MRAFLFASLGATIVYALFGTPSQTIEIKPEIPGIETIATSSVDTTKRQESILFTGDIMLGRSVETLMVKNGYDYPFTKIAGALRDATYVVANLEGPIPKNHAKTPPMGFQFSFKKEIIPELVSHNISAVSQANNHGSDWGEEGWKHTRDILEKNGIKTFGHARKPDDTTASFTVNDREVVVFGINMVSPVYRETKEEKEYLAQAELLRIVHKDALLVAVVHWGEEYVHVPGTPQRRLARALVDRGVDAIIGMHPHVIQGVEVYKEKLIFYSLGNFIFDQYFSKEVQEGYLVSIVPTEDTIQYQILPIQSEASVPFLATSTERDRVLSFIQSVSTSTPMMDGVITLNNK